jgi:hypothetical protein
MPEGASSSWTIRDFVSFHYARWEGSRRKEALTLLGVRRLLVRVGGVAANHLGVLGDLDALALDDLDVVQAGEDLVLDLELGAHGELGVLLDLERLVLQRGLAAGGGEVDGDGVATGRVHGEGEDDADAGVVGVRDVLAGAEAEGLLVALKGLVVGV